MGLSFRPDLLAAMRPDRFADVSYAIVSGEVRPQLLP
jgi:hypothetical protein